MATSGRIHSLNLSNGGVPKVSVREALLRTLGFEGDDHDDKVHNGGAERAVSLWSAEVIDQLVAEGHALHPGAAGENITVAGLTWSAVLPGVHLRIGNEVELEVTSFAAPCRTIEHCFLERKISRISHKVNPTVSRVYARVVRSGKVARGDAVLLVSNGAATPSSALA